jgi:hypothetical protein
VHAVRLLNDRACELELDNTPIRWSDAGKLTVGTYVIRLSQSEVDNWDARLAPSKVEHTGLTFPEHSFVSAGGMFWTRLQPIPRSNVASISNFRRNENASLHPTLSHVLWDLSTLPARPTARPAQCLAYRPRMIYRSLGGVPGQPKASPVRQVSLLIVAMLPDLSILRVCHTSAGTELYGAKWRWAANSRPSAAP